MITKEINIFKNSEFGSVRTLKNNEKVLFCGSDVAKALGYARPNDAVSAHCKGTVKCSTPTNGGIQQMLFITEGDVYRLIIRSKLPNADKFESWIFDDVLPSIHKHGAYMTDETLEKALTNPDFLIQLATKLKEEKEKRMALEVKAEQNKPKVLFADAVAASKTSILIGELAKILVQNGVENIGQKRLFSWLRENGYLISRRGSDYNMPTQRAMELKLFEIKETVITHSDGHTTISKTPKVTGKGQLFFINKFLGKSQIV